MTRRSHHLIAMVLALLLLPGAALAGAKSEAAMLYFGTNVQVPGSESRLNRNNKQIGMKMETHGTAGLAYTVWWVVFNHPEACAGGVGGCLGPDLGNGAVAGSVLWATGGIADEDGEIKLKAQLQEGLHGPLGQVLFGPGLIDAHAAEIHMVLRSHGPASDDPDTLQAQLTTFEGACDIHGCIDEQGALHPPGAAD